MTSQSTIKQFIGLIAWLVICFSASAIGAIASIQAKSFYSQLVQPEWAPPAWLFGPAWTVLYALIAISAWLVWRSGGLYSNRTALTVFFIQLALNALWSWLFFTWQLGELAFAEIMFLWVFIVATLVSFWRVRPFAGVFLVPYLLWVSFAAVLNYSLWQLNPLLLG
jgi:tryptophan-rich sensory protein